MVAKEIVSTEPNLRFFDGVERQSGSRSCREQLRGVEFGFRCGGATYSVMLLGSGTFRRFPMNC
jgi:hypothetical protein